MDRTVILEKWFTSSHGGVAITISTQHNRENHSFSLIQCRKYYKTKSAIKCMPKYQCIVTTQPVSQDGLQDKKLNWLFVDDII